MELQVLQLALAISKASNMDAGLTIKWAFSVCSCQYTWLTDEEKERELIHLGYDGPVQKDTCQPVRKRHSTSGGNCPSETLDCTI